MKAVAKIISKDELVKRQAMDEFLKSINFTPPKEWVKTNKYANNSKYISIGKIESLLTKVYQDWNVEILDSGQILNSVYVTVRVNYKNPINNEWQHQDGIGAVPIKVDKGENASNLSAIKSDAIATGLPSAKSFAIKDAVGHIGRAFGRDLNREDFTPFEPTYAKDEDTKKKLEAEYENN